MGSHTEFEYFSNANDVRIAGCWTAWMPESMSRVHNGDRWTYSAPLTPGAAVQFKFVVDGVWMAASHYDLTDDGHGAKNNTRCVDKLCTHDKDAHAPPQVHEHVEGDEHPAHAAPAPPVEEAEHSLRETVLEKKETAEALVQSTDAVSDMSHISPDAGVSASAEKLAAMAMSTSQSSDTATALPPVQENPKLVKMISDCISDQEDSKPQEGPKEGPQEDFEVEDESETDEKLTEKVQNLKLEGNEEKKTPEDKNKDDQNNCVIM